jgi:DNA ligase-1
MHNAIIIILLAGCLLLPSWLYAKDSIPSLALAKHFKNEMQSSFYWVSEKLDGIRCYWNGEALLTRNGNPIYAPQWFTDSLPNVELDGELYIGRGSYQLLTRIALDKKPNLKLWEQVTFHAFDLPSSKAPFEIRQNQLKDIIGQSAARHLKLVEQKMMNNLPSIQTHLRGLVNSGAEGLMLRTPESPYETGRTNHLLKMKLRRDAEARVIAYQTGRGKFENMMGAIWVEMEDGTLFKIGTGFSNHERQNPPAIGSDITYSYQGFTDKGLPRFASFTRTKKPE